jgi:hypothetical protein
MLRRDSLRKSRATFCEPRYVRAARAAAASGVSNTAMEAAVWRFCCKSYSPRTLRRTNAHRLVEPTLPVPLPVVAPALFVPSVPLPRSARAEAVLPGSTVGFSPALVVTGEDWVPLSRAVLDPLSHPAISASATAATVTVSFMMFLSK